MSAYKKMFVLILLFAMIGLSIQKIEAITYVTDTGGYAYDEARAVTNLAPAIALGTVAIVGIIAIAVQNSHGHSSSSSHYGSSSSSSCRHCDSYYNSCRYSYSSYSSHH